MGFLFGFVCGLLFIPFSILAGVYYFFTYSESYSEKRQELLDQEKRLEDEQNLDFDAMPPSALYASYLGRQQGGGTGLIPEHLDPQYQFAGWISVKRIPEVDHRIIEPSTKKNTNKNVYSNNRKGSNILDDGVHNAGVAGSIGAAAAQDPRFNYVDTLNPHLSLPPGLQARFKDSKYGVIKGATMFIYETEHMQECLGVITLPNYQISVPGNQKDSHIFSKRNPIWLKYQPSSNHTRHSTADSDASLSSSRDYYLSMVNCVEKEDLYFTLLRCSKLKISSRSFLREIPKRDSTLFDKSAMDTLIRSIHSNEHQFQAAWLNALLGRIFLGVYKTPQIKDMVFQKLVDKLSRVRLPNFLNDMRMKSVHLGDGVPLITRPKLLTLKPNGEMIMDLNILYQGGFRAEVEAEAVVTVTKKIQPIKVSLVLVMTLIRLEGRMQVWIKPPPCNRIWYGFYNKPHVEMKIEPVVSDKHIKSNLIIKAIENKMLEAIAETMVLPNMDDVPFSDSEGAGGIFGEEILPGGAGVGTGTGSVGAASDTASTVTSQTTKALPKRSYSPGPRSATISLADMPSSAPRSAIELPNDIRQRTDNLTAPSIYQSPSATRSLASLGDEVMQTNYTYDSQSKKTSALDDDPMRSGPLTESPEEIISRALPIQGSGSRGSKASNESGLGSQGYDGGSNVNSASRLFNRKNVAVGSAQSHNRRGSLDPDMLLSYTTGSSTGVGYSSQFPTMDAARPLDEPWPHYGICEYEPSVPEGGKLSNKERKKLKEKLKTCEREKNGADGDRASLNSKDSGDTGSTHTGNAYSTENTGQASSIYGFNSTHSTMEAGSSSSSSGKMEKFSITKMFQGFRKRHTKGSHSGSSLTLPNNSTDVLGRDDLDAQGEIDQRVISSILTESDEGLAQDMEEFHHHNPQDFESAPSPSSGTLLNAYQTQFRQKFESTPNLSLSNYSPEQDDAAASEGVVPSSGPSSARSLQEGADLSPVRHPGSPVPSVYAASLFATDDPVNHLNTGHGSENNRSPTHHHNHHLMNISPKLGTALRKLRERSRGVSGASKDELSIPSEDLNVALRQQLQQPKQGLSGSGNANLLGAPAEGHGVPSYMDHELQQHTAMVRSGDSYPYITNGDNLEDEQLPVDVNRPTAHVPQSQSAGVYPSRTGASRAAAAPQITLQKPSPYLTQGGPSSPRYAEGTFVAEGYQERLSLDECHLGQHNPKNLSLLQRHQLTTSAREDRHLLSNGDSCSNNTSGILTSPTIIRPRRHSINHPPSITPAGHNAHHQHLGHAYGLGMVPTSPLRREFTREEDEADISPTMAPGDSNAERTRNNSDTVSITSTTSSSRSITSKDAPPHLPSTFRNILSSLGSKGKKKGGPPAPRYLPNGSDPYNAVAAVGMIGVVAMGRAAHEDMTSDPFIGVDPADEQRYQQQSRSTSQESTRSSSLRSSTDKSSVSSSGMDLSMDGGDTVQPARGSIERSRAGSTLSSAQKDILHARPGYVGEYPTPVRMHSMLNRASAAILSGDAHEKESATIQGRRLSLSPSQDVRLSASESRNTASPMVNSNSTPLQNHETLPEPFPVSKHGEKIPMGASVQAPLSETSTLNSTLIPVSSSTSISSRNTSTSISSVSTVEKYEGSQKHDNRDHAGDLCQRSPSDSSGQTMTRCEYELIVKTQQSRRLSITSAATNEKMEVHEAPVSHESPGRTTVPRLEEPLRENKQQLLTDTDISTDRNQYLQPSPTNKNQPHLNIFKRLLRRKSEDTLQQSQRQQQRGSPSPSSLYMNPASSLSQSSILTNSTASSTKSLPYVHNHHHHHQQPPHLFGHDLLAAKEPSSTDPTRVRAQSSGQPQSSSSSSPDATTKTFGRTKTRPRSSTLGALVTRV
ncbi:hypothetical protein BG011_005115 [Mortierella polycephala]|uniref:SMP-LTD domain-containing protein n=1 Tax=Mortierella polycephala TaxID=41804 RepID=A0A9P6PY05_9FUNG|nr:hypothetical protein BG011_005115 [Mortierella polycephala]